MKSSFIKILSLFLLSLTANAQHAVVRNLSNEEKAFVAEYANMDGLLISVQKDASLSSSFQLENGTPIEIPSRSFTSTDSNPIEWTYFFLDRETLGKHPRLIIVPADGSWKAGYMGYGFKGKKEFLTSVAQDDHWTWFGKKPSFDKIQNFLAQSSLSLVCHSFFNGYHEVFGCEPQQEYNLGAFTFSYEDIKSPKLHIELKVKPVE